MFFNICYCIYIFMCKSTQQRYTLRWQGVMIDRPGHGNNCGQFQRPSSCSLADMYRNREALARKTKCLDSNQVNCNLRQLIFIHLSLSLQPWVGPDLRYLVSYSVLRRAVGIPDERPIRHKASACTGPHNRTRPRTNIYALSRIRNHDPVYDRPRATSQTARPVDRQIFIS
jgi:hypothetical protein